jgi:hypothetical protein
MLATLAYEQASNVVQVTARSQPSFTRRSATALSRRGLTPMHVSACCCCRLGMSIVLRSTRARLFTSARSSAASSRVSATSGPPPQCCQTVTQTGTIEHFSFSRQASHRIPVVIDPGSSHLCRKGAPSVSQCDFERPSKHLGGVEGRQGDVDNPICATARTRIFFRQRASLSQGGENGMRREHLKQGRSPVRIEAQQGLNELAATHALLCGEGCALPDAGVVAGVDSACRMRPCTLGKLTSR